jgi:zinc/manganese transport system substrate-binding protein
MSGRLLAGRLRKSAGVFVALPVVAALGLPLAFPGLTPDRFPVAAQLASSPRVTAVGAENEYANVISQIGGTFVRVSAVMKNPNSDPHTFEASPSVARQIASAELVVQNGLGYDSFMQTIENASPSSRRKVIVVQKLLAKPDSTRNPHLWYSPRTMPAVARAVAKALTKLDPAHRSTFERNMARFDASLGAWTRAIASLRARYHGAPVATSEPVADYLLDAAGLDVKTPFSFQADVMNGVDPSPQDVTYVQHLLSARLVKAFVYNVQVTDTLTSSLVQLAHRARVPVVGVYETMPVPGFDYQRWMIAEVGALRGALARGVSAPRL